MTTLLPRDRLEGTRMRLCAHGDVSATVRDAGGKLYLCARFLKEDAKWVEREILADWPKARTTSGNHDEHSSCVTWRVNRER